MKSPAYCKIPIAALAAFGLAASMPAQTAPSTAGAATPDETVALPQVTVHAERQDENLQTVPIAVSVVTSETIQENDIQTLGELQYLVPALSGYEAQNSLNASIRGQGTNLGGIMPGVLLYLNEVPMAAPSLNGLAGYTSGVPGQYFDLEDAEVLRGPQGTLFGRNTVGGAILLQTARPTNEFGGDLQVSYGNYNDREINGVVNVPVIKDKLLVRIAFTGQLRDGYVNVLGEPAYPNGIDEENRDFWGARITVTYRPTSKVQNDTIVSRSVFNSNGSPYFFTQFNPAVAAVSKLYPTLPQLLAEQQALGVRTDLPQYVTNFSSGGATTIENITRIDLSDDLTFRNILGYQASGQYNAVNGSGTALALFAAPTFPETGYAQQYSEEAQLRAKFFNQRLNLVTGAFIIDEPEGAYRLVGTTLEGKLSEAENRFGYQSDALYSQGTYDLSALVKGLSFIAGFRYTWDNLSFGSRSGYLTGEINPTTNEVREGAPSWTLGLNYQIDPKTLVYLASRKGYRSGGQNGTTSAGVKNPNYGPEYVQDVECGVKSDWNLGGIAIRTDADVYYEFYTDLQVTSIFINPTTLTSSTTIQNDSDARVWGIEGEMLAQITKDFQIGPSYDFMSFVYTNFASNVAATEITLLDADVHLHGPEHKYGLTARYHLPLRQDLGDISLRGDYMWQSMTASASVDSATDVYIGGDIPSYGLLNLAANWDNFLQKRIDLSLFCTNVANKVYVVGASSLYAEAAFATALYGEPRMYGVRLRYHF